MPKWVRVESFYWRIGNGRTVLFGIDIWCGNMPLKQGFLRLFRLTRYKESSVADFFRFAGLCRYDWNEFFTRSLLGREEVMRRELVERVSGMVLISDMEDKLCWANDKNEEFLVKKCSELLISDEGVDINFSCDKFWKLNVPPTVRSFLWMLAIDRIPSKEFLVKIGVNLHDISVSCPWCESELEKTSHLFFKCKYIEGFWIKIFDWWEVVWNQVDGFEYFFALCNKVKMVGIRKSF